MAPAACHTDNNARVAAHVDAFVASIETYLGASRVELDGGSLSIPLVAAIAHRPSHSAVELSHACKPGVDKSVAWLESAVARKCDIYGITTGFGACSDKRTHDVLDLQVEFVRHQISGIFGSGPPSLAGAHPLSTIRAAMAVRINSLLLGMSAIRWEILEALAKLVNANVLPRCPLRGSITASGDLMPLTYISAVLVGWPSVDAFVNGGRDVVPSLKALQIAGIGSPFKLRAKEGLALGNGTSFATAEAALVLFDTQVFFLLTELCSGLFCEVLHARTETVEPKLHEVKNHRGQIEVAATLNWFYRGSSLVERSDHIHSLRALKLPRQDRYAPRSIPHWLGPQLESIEHAIMNVQDEANSANDNPLIDVDKDACLHGANFHGTFIGFPMDSVRVAVAALAKLLFAQFSELLMSGFSKGLPGNLALGPNYSLDFGLKGLDISMAAYLSELLHLATPVTAFVQSAEQHNQDVNSLGLISARKTADALHLLKMMLSNMIVALMQAVDLRHLEEKLEIAIASTLKEQAEQCGLPPILTTKLLNVIGLINVFDYEHDVTNDTLPFMAEINSKVLQYIVAESQVPSSGIGVSVAHSFTSRLKPALQETIQQTRREFMEELTSGAKLTPHVTGPAARIRGSKAFPLYEYVRGQLKTEIISGATEGCRSANEDVQKVFNAIDERHILVPLLKCFKGFTTIHSGPNVTNGNF